MHPYNHLTELSELSELSELARRGTTPQPAHKFRLAKRIALRARLRQARQLGDI